MLYKKSLSGKFFDVFNIALLIGIALLCLIPILHVFFASISDPAYLSRHDGLLLRPLGKPTLDGYVKVFQDSAVIKAYLNTIFYVIAGTVINITLTIFAGYALSRKKLLWKNLIVLFIAVSMWFNGGLIPTYMVVYKLGIIDTRWAMLLPTAVSAFNIIIMRTGFSGLPDSLEESAKIDGANDFVVLFRIMIPLAKSVIAVVTLFYVVFHWNEWFSALIYLPNSRELRPLQLILREVLIKNDISSMQNAGVGSGEVDLSSQLVKYSTIIVSTLPILLVYPFAQKHFVKGVMIGSLKG